MATIINAGQTALTITPDNSGQLTLSANGSTAITANTTGHCTFTNNFASVAGYPAYQCRAWVNFDGTGTPAIRASGNVSSIGDLGTGQYQVNFTNAMPDANYSISGSDVGSSASLYYSFITSSGDASTTTYFRFVNLHQSATASDQNYLMLQVFR